MDEERDGRTRRRRTLIARLVLAVTGSAVGMIAGRHLPTPWQVFAGIVGAVLLLVALDVVLAATRYEVRPVGDPSALHAPKPGAARRRRLPWSRATRTRVWMVVWGSVGTAAGALAAWDLPRMWTVVVAFAGGLLAVVAHAVVWIVADLRRGRGRPGAGGTVMDRDGGVYLVCSCGEHLLPITPAGPHGMVMGAPLSRHEVEAVYGPLIPSPRAES